VLVYSTADGNYVNGLEPNQFHLFEHGKETEHHVDVFHQPISLVICLQVETAHVEGCSAGPRLANLIAPMLIGEGRGSER